MSSGFSGSWWTFALRGLLAVLFGLWIIVWPSLALSTLPLLITLLGAYILIDGVVTLIAAMRFTERRGWLLLIEGILGILAGLAALFRPGIAALAVLYMVAAWVILSGLSKVASAIRDRTEHEWLMVASGTISTVFGLILVFLPGTSLLALEWVVGIYALAVGTAFVIYSYRLRVRELQRSEDSRVI